MRPALAWTALAVLLASGCLDLADTTMDESIRISEHEENGCASGTTNGHLTPTDALAVHAEVDTLTQPVANADLDVTSYGVGQLRLVLDDEGEEVWRHEIEAGTIGNYDTNVGGLDGGNYTLTASTDDGVRDVEELRLSITWGTGSCP